MSKRREFLGAAALAALSATLPRAAQAQGAARTARILVGFPAGGGTDAVARLFGEKLRPLYPAGMIVDNRAGAAGRLAVEALRAAEPDGNTLFFTPDFIVTVYPHSYRKLAYDPQKDLTPVALCVRTAYALTAGPGLPAGINTLAEFVQWCRANPKQAAYASTGAGGTAHFAGLMLSRAAGVDITHVPYKGGAPALQDMLGGQIPVSINPVGEVLPHMKSGKIRVLATTGARRIRFMPEVPTLAEAGFPGIVVEPWLGFFAPARTPEAVVAKLSGAINDLIRQDDVRDSLARFGMETVASTPAAFATQIRTEIDMWGPVVKASGFTAED